MRSLVWINQFALLPSDGGGTRHFELGRELVRYGWHVSIFASDLHLHTREYTRRAGAVDRRTIRVANDGVDIRWLWAARYQRNDWRRAWNWYTFYRSVLRESDSFQSTPDVVIGSSPQLFAAVAARTLARNLGVPFVLEVRDLWPESLLAVGGRKGLMYRLLDRIAAGLYRDADRILVLARGTGEYIAARGISASKIAYVPNGVDTTLIAPNLDTYRHLAQERPFTLIYAGAHGPANGLDCVLDAAEILGSSANIRFLLVGDGPIKSGLQEDAARRALTNVEFRDAVSKHSLAEIFSESDAGLMVLRDAPLFSFGVSPNKLFDYLAASMPVVCNVPGDTADMLSAARAGVQTTDSTGHALAVAVQKLAGATKSDLQRMGKDGRRWVEENHSREVLGRKLDSFLNECVAK